MATIKAGGVMPKCPDCMSRAQVYRANVAGVKEPAWQCGRCGIYFMEDRVAPRGVSSAVRSCLLLTFAALLGGCATVLNSDTIVVTVKSEPPGAGFSYGGVEYKTPALVPFVRAWGDPPALELRASSGQTESVPMASVMAPQVLFNVFFLTIGAAFALVDMLDDRGMSVRPTDIAVNFSTGCRVLDGMKSGEAAICKPDPIPAGQLSY